MTIRVEPDHSGPWHEDDVTERARAVLDQIEAVRFGLTGRLVNGLGSEHAGSVRALVQQMVQAAPAPARSHSWQIRRRRGGTATTSVAGALELPSRRWRN